MKILHIFGQMTRNGAQLRTLDATEQFSRDQFVFDYVSLSGKAGELDEEIGRRGGRVVLMPIHSVIFVFKFIYLLRLEKYDVVHSHVHHSSGFILLLARLCGVKGRIAHFRNTNSRREHTSTLAASVTTRIKKYLINAFSTDILAVSRTTMSAAWSEAWSSDERCCVIYNGIKSTDLLNDATRQKLRVDFMVGDSTCLVAHVGRFDVEKNHQLIMEIAKEVKNQGIVFKFLLLGNDSGVIADSCREFIETHDLQNEIQFLGLREDVLDVLGACDVFLFPSLWEGLPGSLLEALSIGLVSVTSDIEPIKEIIEVVDGTAINAVSLESDSSVWAKAVLDAYAVSTSSDVIRQGIKAKFDSGPFELGSCSNSFESIWSKYA